MSCRVLKKKKNNNYIINLFLIKQRPPRGNVAQILYLPLQVFIFSQILVPWFFTILISFLIPLNTHTHIHTHTYLTRNIQVILYWRISKSLLSTHIAWEVCCIIKMVRCPCYLSLVYASCPNTYACILSCLSFVQHFVILLAVDCQDPLSMKIVQARILEWFAMLSSRGSSQFTDWSHVSYVSCIGR